MRSTGSVKVAGLVLVLVASVAAGKTGSGLMTQPSMKASAWVWQYSPCMPGSLTALAGGLLGGYSNIPPNATSGQDTCGIHYLTTPFNGDLTDKVSVSMTASAVSTGGTPVLNTALDPDNVCAPGTGMPPSARLLLHRNVGGKYKLNAAGYRPGDPTSLDYARWWSVDAIDLSTFATTTVTTGLQDPSRWVNVNGWTADHDSETLAGFRYALGIMGDLGVAFGGCYFYSHGINMLQGNAQFVLLNVQVN